MIKISGLPAGTCDRCFRPAVTRLTIKRRFLPDQRVSACGVCVADIARKRRRK